LQPAYAVAQFRDPQAEVERLARQAEVVAAEDEALLRLGLPERGRLLDLGCGPGFVAQRLRRGREGLQVVGTDRDRSSLKVAGRHLAPLGAEASALPFAEASFDFVLVRLVLRHLPRPEQVLLEIRRVLEPGGRIAVMDTDDDTLVLHPAPEGFAAVLAARQETFRRRGADPFIGRRLAPLLREAGFADVQVVPLPVTSTDIGAATFAAIVLAPITDAVDRDLCGDDAVLAAARALTAWGERDDAFGLTTALVAGGRRRE
jgi:ubiquinone/menaquinone biosynthesis C-methylase UbiE